MPPELRPRKEAHSGSKPIPSTSSKPRGDAKGESGNDFVDSTWRTVRRSATPQNKPASVRRGRGKQPSLICLSSDDDKRSKLNTPESGKKQRRRGTRRCGGKTVITQIDVEVSSQGNDIETEELPPRERTPESIFLSSRRVSNIPSELIQKMKSGKQMNGDTLGDETGITHAVQQDSPSMNGAELRSPNLPTTRAETRSSSKQNRKRCSTPVSATQTNEKIVSRKLFKAGLDRTINYVESAGNEGCIAEVVMDNAIGIARKVTPENGERKKTIWVENMDDGTVKEGTEFVKEGPSEGRKEERKRGNRVSAIRVEALDTDKESPNLQGEKTGGEERIEKSTDGEASLAYTPQNSEHRKLSRRHMDGNGSLMKTPDNDSQTIQDGKGSKENQMTREDFPFSEERTDLLGKDSALKSKDRRSKDECSSRQEDLEENCVKHNRIDKHKAVMDSPGSQEGTQTVKADEGLTEKTRETSDFFHIHEKIAIAQTKISLDMLEGQSREETTGREDLNEEEYSMASFEVGELEKPKEKRTKEFEVQNQEMSSIRKRGMKTNEGLIADVDKYRDSVVTFDGKKGEHEYALASFSSLREPSGGGHVRTPYKKTRICNLEQNDMIVEGMQMYKKESHQIGGMTFEENLMNSARKQNRNMSASNFDIQDKTSEDTDIKQKMCNLNKSSPLGKQGTLCKGEKVAVERGVTGHTVRMGIDYNSNSVQKNEQGVETKNTLKSRDACNMLNQMAESEEERLSLATVLPLTTVELEEAVNFRGNRKEEGYVEFETGNISENEEMTHNGEQDRESGRGGEDEDDEEMVKLFVRSLKAHVSPTPNISKKGQEKQSVSTINDFGMEPTTKDVQINVFDALGKRAPEVALFGMGVLCFSETVLLNKIKKDKAKHFVSETVWQKEGQLQDGLLVPPRDPQKLNKLTRKQAKDTAGAKWFDLPAQTITPELKKELQILKLRGAMDPKRHYKAADSKSLPKYFQVGTVVEGPADFYSGRLTKKERKCSFADELLSDSNLRSYRKRKYMEIQEQKQAGGKKFWKQKNHHQKPSWAIV